MIAGDGLDFEEGKKFQKLNVGKPELAQAAKKGYADHPEKFHRVKGDLHKGDFGLAGKSFECLILRRRGAKVYLLAAAEIVNGKGIREEDLEYFKKQFS